MKKQSKDIIESNKLILEFLLERAGDRFRLEQPFKDSFICLQRKTETFNNWLTIAPSEEKSKNPTCYFETDWNQIMWVVDEIRKIQLESMTTVRVKIDNYGCTISNGVWNSTEIAKNTQTEGADVKVLTYKTIVGFIKYYNEKK